jgi:ABC-type lipopolysaccharide export system ATPase subunit
MPNLLEIDSVIKTYNTYQVLTDIYLKCKTGDIIGMLGRNGTGKTTLLKILFGTLSADSKFIRIDNKIYEQPYKSASELCYLPQDSFLPRHLTVKKVVELYLGKSKVSFFLDDSILFNLKTSKISHLSGGELRYLEIKLLLNLDSKFVLLDEPFNGMSPILIDSVKKLLLDNSTNKGIILTDHDYRNVLDIANRFCLVFDGGLKEINDKKELVNWGYLTESRI